MNHFFVSNHNPHNAILKIHFFVLTIYCTFHIDAMGETMYFYFKTLYGSID